MKTYRFLFGSVLVSMLVLFSCGSTAAPSALIIGTWEADMSGEIQNVEFMSDGTVQPEGEELQRYIIIEGDPNIVQIMDLNSDRVYVELELVFDGENQCTLSDEEMTATLKRVE